MRSRSVASFLAAHGFEVYTLEGGYKAFRNWAEAVLARPQKVCAVAGATGSGKTEVLQELSLLGSQTIDLEDLACHKGSVFGHLGEGPQPSSEHFRNLVASQWAALDPERFVFLEDEGSRIGRVSLPGELFRKLRRAHLVVHLDVPFALRAERSLATYGPFGPERLAEAVARFRGKAGGAKTDYLLDLLARGDLRPVCEEVLRNYDKTYEHHVQRGRAASAIARLPVDSLDSAAVARSVAELAGQRERQVSSSLEEATHDPEVEAAAAEASGEGAGPVRQATCFCGAVVVKVEGDPVSVSICHCSVCRKLSGAPFVASALFEPSRVEVLSEAAASAGSGALPHLAETRTSPAVVRRRCAACFAPVAGFLGKRYVAVPLALFDWGGRPPPAAWRPQRHLHYEDRVLDVHDELPKYAGRSGGPLWSGPELQ